MYMYIYKRVYVLGSDLGGVDGRVWSEGLHIFQQIPVEKQRERGITHLQCTCVCLHMHHFSYMYMFMYMHVHHFSYMYMFIYRYFHVHVHVHVHHFSYTCMYTSTVLQ